VSPSRSDWIAPSSRRFAPSQNSRYLWRFRDEPSFNESLIDLIADDLYQQMRPRWLRVTGTFNPRGGIRITAAAERGDKEYRPS